VLLVAGDPPRDRLLALEGDEVRAGAIRQDEDVGRLQLSPFDDRDQDRKRGPAEPRGGRPDRSVLHVGEAQTLPHHGQAAAVLMRVGHEGIDGLQQRVRHPERFHLSACRLPGDLALLGGVVDLRLDREIEREEGPPTLCDASEIRRSDPGLERC
jgi:hypothetical protein